MAKRPAGAPAPPTSHPDDEATQNRRTEAGEVLAHAELSRNEPENVLSQVDAHSSLNQFEAGDPAAKLKALLDISQGLGSSLQLEDVLARILESLFRIFPQTTCGYILQRDKPSGSLVLAPSSTKPTPRTRPVLSVAKWRNRSCATE